MSTVRNQVRTIQITFEQPQANTKQLSPKIIPKSFSAYCRLSTSDITVGVSRHWAVGERWAALAFRRTLGGLPCFLAELAVPCSTAPLLLLVLTVGDRTPLGHPEQEDLLLAGAFMLIFVSEISEQFGRVCTECYNVLVSSQSCKLEFYFAKIGQNIYSSLSHGTEAPLLLTSPNRASVQRENVLEYPLFLDECRAFPICHLSTDKSPSLVSTCSQPPFVIWKWQWLLHAELKSNE